MGPILTLNVHETLRAATGSIECSLDLGKTTSQVEVSADGWRYEGQLYPFMAKCKDRTIYYWDGESFEPVSRYSGALIKLVPTEWGPPTFEIDGIKMLPSAQLSPYDDARRKVDLIQPEGKTILDTCGGLGYFAAWCLQRNARQIMSFEKNPDVIWIRSHNPWSPEADAHYQLVQGDSSQQISQLPAASFDAILHDPPRFGIAGELYSQVFYHQLARVLKRKGRLFHYTGTPNKLTSGRDVPNEVAKRLREAGFTTEIIGDGVLAIKK
ncbi:MAG: methyltransferase [Gammaproteobacteria bacterium]|nr:methyltransferase [Gammaproteobacteria bacterium]